MDRYAACLAAALFALALSAAPGSTQDPPPGIAPESLIEAARAALDAGELDDAELLLEGVEPGEGNVDDLDFLHGSIALRRGDWQGAIARFRAMLARNPDLPRVRLDLALAYFGAGEDGNAAYHFRLALGDGDLPPAVRARALSFLDRIRRRKTWSVTGSLALLPDSNVNAATSARLVDLFGLPARLSDDARQTSGIGLSVNVSGAYEGRISEDLRFRVGGGLRTRTYDESDFNEQVLSLRTGPRFLFEKFDLRPELTSRFRWLGGEIYSRSVGVQLSSDWLVAPTSRLSASVGGERIFHESFLGDGYSYGTHLGLQHALGKATLLRVDTSFRRQTLEQDAHSWDEFSLAVSVKREFPLGFVLSAGPSYRRRVYGAPRPIFGPAPRLDATLAGHVKVSNRHVSVFGFMPEVTVRHERRDSNLRLYDYERTAGEIGMVRTF